VTTCMRLPQPPSSMFSSSFGKPECKQGAVLARYTSLQANRAHCVMLRQAGGGVRPTPSHSHPHRPTATHIGPLSPTCQTVEGDRWQTRPRVTQLASPSAGSGGITWRPRSCGRASNVGWARPHLHPTLRVVMEALGTSASRQVFSTSGNSAMAGSVTTATRTATTNGGGSRVLAELHKVAVGVPHIQGHDGPHSSSARHRAQLHRHAGPVQCRPHLQWATED
jgi:hypothetical protein